MRIRIPALYEGVKKSGGVTRESINYMRKIMDKNQWYCKMGLKETSIIVFSSYRVKFVD